MASPLQSRAAPRGRQEQQCIESVQRTVLPPPSSPFAAWSDPRLPRAGCRSLLALLLERELRRDLGPLKAEDGRDAHRQRARDRGRGRGDGGGGSTSAGGAARANGGLDRARGEVGSCSSVQVGHAALCSGGESSCERDESGDVDDGAMSASERGAKINSAPTASCALSAVQDRCMKLCYCASPRKREAARGGQASSSRVRASGLSSTTTQAGSAL